jgi:hypothetical protein
VGVVAIVLYTDLQALYKMKKRVLTDVLFSASGFSDFQLDIGF